jgi:hypothetical protein
MKYRSSFGADARIDFETLQDRSTFPKKRPLSALPRLSTNRAACPDSGGGLLLNEFLCCLSSRKARREFSLVRFLAPFGAGWRTANGQSG